MSLLQSWLIILLLIGYEKISTERVNSSRHMKFKRNPHSYIIPDKMYEFKEIELLKFIFNAIKFNEVACEYTFQNCLLDLNIQKNLYTHLSLSQKCLPLQKSKYCMQEFNYRNSDCSYNAAQKKVTENLKLLNKNLEICVKKYPNSLPIKSENNIAACSINQFFFTKFELFLFSIVFLFSYKSCIIFDYLI